MPAFRFRAQVAIDLRQKEFDEAQRVLGRARQAVAAAAAALADAAGRVAEAERHARDAIDQACDATRRIWHRNWIVRQRQEQVRLHRLLVERESEEQRAAQAAMRARQRLRSLERLRDRLWQAHQAGERRREQRDFDTLATLRHQGQRPAAH